MKLLLILSDQNKTHSKFNLLAQDLSVVGKYGHTISIIDLGRRNFFWKLWRDRDGYDTILTTDRGLFILCLGIFWRLTDKKIWWLNDFDVKNFDLMVLSWLADRTFYFRPRAFMTRYPSAEFIGEEDWLPVVFGMNLETSYSRLKIISPTFVRYIFSGLIVVGVNILSLAFLTRILGWWYLTASICSFFIAFVVSFLLQKTLTYRDSIWQTWNWQLAGYFLVSLLNLALNTLILYILVDWVGLNDLLAQAVTVAMISFVLFFVYGRLIFRPKLID